MSGRSAHARKKMTTQAKPGTDYDAAFGSPDTGGLGLGFPTGSLGTGVGIANARFLKFSEPLPQTTESLPEMSRTQSMPTSVWSGSSGESDTQVSNYAIGEVGQSGDYAPARRPALRTEGVSGIEKSGFRSKLDKRSEDVRKGLAKRLAFRRKKKDDGNRPGVDTRSSSDNYTPRPWLDRPDDGNTSSNASEAPLLKTLSHPQPPRLRDYGQNLGEGNSPGPPPPLKLPPVPVSTTPPVKRWIGTGRPAEIWNPPTRDPELWDPNGDVTVVLGYKEQPYQPPSFRLSSHIIEATESRYLISLLRESSVRQERSELSSPISSPDASQYPIQDHQSETRDLGSFPKSAPDYDGVRYTMYFPTHPSLSKIDQLRHQITTRNFFALLCHCSLAGLSLFQALTDLQHRLDSYMPPENQNVQLIIHHLVMRGIDDIRLNPETAVSLLAWSESPEVRWEQGWRDCFVHCVGMYSDIERCIDYRYLTPVTRSLLERAFLEAQFRIQAAEDRLAEFSFADMWPMRVTTVGEEAKEAAERLQMMLLDYYFRVYQYWPPLVAPYHSQPASSINSDLEDDETPWLTRTLATALQKDFGALYDYLVDRDIAWDVSEARAGRKWMIVSQSGEAFDAESLHLPLTDILIEFDNKFRFPHIPHPYPLVPESILMAGSRQGTRRSLEKSTIQGGARPRAGSLERKYHLVYGESSNISELGSDFTQRQLVDAFTLFEKTDKIGEVDPAVARLGRWVLIYGILQILASVSVDTPGVRYRENVPYHLGVYVKGSPMPPWRRGSGSAAVEEATHELSYCWTTPQTWTSPGSDSEAEPLGDVTSQRPVRP